MDRPDPGAARRPRRRARGRHLPDPRRGAAPVRDGGQARVLHRGADRRPARSGAGALAGDLAAGAGRLRTGARAARPDGPGSAAGGALDGAAGGRVGRPDLRHLGQAQHPQRGCAAPLRAGDRGSLGGRAGRRLAPPRPLLHPLRRWLQHPGRDRWRRPAGPLPRRLAADCAADGRGARDGAAAARGAGAADRARRSGGERSTRGAFVTQRGTKAPRRRTVGWSYRHGGRSSRSRRPWPAASPTSRRCRPGATS